MTETVQFAYTETVAPKLIGGNLAVDFANTADWHATDNPLERLTTYSGLVYWSWHAGAIDPVTAQRLLAMAQRRPVEADAILDRAIQLREALYGIFRALAHDEPVGEAPLALFNEALAESLGRLRVSTREEAFVWEWDGMELSLSAMLWPVVRAAADLLTSENRGRLGQCADDRGCGWLFIDMSKNHSRRWCSMEDCGNRAKAMRHYSRARGEATA